MRSKGAGVHAGPFLTWTPAQGVQSGGDMLEAMQACTEARILLLDFCGDQPFVCLSQGEAILSCERLAERDAAAGWLTAVRRVLEANLCLLSQLSAVGVVGGPGSFTGVRAGLAAAKGLCEATGLRLAVVSRLAVLAHAAGDNQAIALLYAGRDQVYLRVPFAEGEAARESMLPLEDLAASCDQGLMVITEARLLERLRETKVPACVHARRVEVLPEHLLAVVRQELAQDSSWAGSDPASVDANYVRNENHLYHRRVSVPAPQA